jgi:outer membrane protein assembly factor BamB
MEEGAIRSPQGGHIVQIRHGLPGRGLIALSVSALVMAPSVARADWSQFHNTLSRRGATTESTLTRADAKNGLHEVWGTATGASDEGINSSPAVVAGVVYVGSDDGSVWAFDSTDGHALWSFATGGAVRSSPAVVDGVVYAGSSDGSVYAIDTTTGTEIWAFATGGDVTASPLVVDGLVFVGSRGGIFYALDAATGVVTWSKRTWGVWHGAAYDAGTVFVGSDQSKVFAFEATTGNLQWSATLDGRVRCTPSVWQGAVYVGDDAAKVYSLSEATGTLLWASRAASVDAGAVVRSSPAVGHGRVFVDTGETTPMDGHAVAFDATNGQQIWRMHLADYATSSPALANGVLYLGSFDTRLYAFGVIHGRELWTSGWGSLTRGITSSPAVSGAKVYVGVRDGSLYAFGR